MAEGVAKLQQNFQTIQAVQTPEVVGKLISFALAELSADNAHHEFEHLCRHITRRRIYSNIIPATGPVSGGGDKGADFETLPVQSEFGTSKYWRLIASAKVLFACSLEKNLKKKIRADVKAAAEFGEPVEQMYFFYNRPIKVGDRNKFKEAALKDHGIKLEIVDGVAIAEFLADPELLWIAERYLSLPSEVSLPISGAVPSWYSTLVTTPGSELSVNSDTFYRLKSAVRYASGEADRHSDLPKLISRLRLFRSHPDRVVARKAFYEEFVAALRGLNAAEGYESQVVDYLSHIDKLEDPAELEDASIILSYANGACVRGILKIDVVVRRKFRDELLARLESLIGDSPSFVACSLLFTKGHTLLISAALDDDIGTQTPFPVARATESAIEVWSVLLEYSREITLFPVERLQPLISFVFPYVTSEKFGKFVKKLDALTAERAGAQSLAEEHIKRASALLDNEDYLRSLTEFHEALRLSHSLESQFEAIRVCLQLSQLYQHLGLYHAAKYYGLVASFAALRFPEDALRKMAAVGLAQAAEADYASGASLLFFLTFTMFVSVANEYAIAGKEGFREKQWAKVNFYSLLLTRAAKIIGESCHNRCLRLLRQFDAEDIYVASKNELEKMFQGLDRSALRKRYAEEGIATPFCDYASVRVTSWKQLGILWRVEWASQYEGERHGEALCAVLQIVLAALTGTEFSAIATEVAIVLDTSHSGKLEIKQVADNDVLRFSLSLDSGRVTALEEQLAVVYHVLAACSAIRSEEFKTRFEEEFQRDLPRRIGVYISPADVFRQFYSQPRYEELHQDDPPGPGESEPTRPLKEVSEVSALHPQFDEREAIQLIENRYRNTTKMFPITLRQLSKNAEFQKLISKLRDNGWKDWHILLAVTNVRLNFLVDVHDPRYKELMRAAMKRGETMQDPLTPDTAFDEKSLRIALKFSQISTVTGMGFRVHQMTPNTPGVDAFLRRFRYWELDAPHSDPFEPISE